MRTFLLSVLVDKHIFFSSKGLRPDFCLCPRCSFPQGDFNFVHHSQWQWNPRGLRKKMSPLMVSHCPRRGDVHQFHAHLFPEAHCALCFWNSPVSVVSGAPPQVWFFAFCFKVTVTLHSGFSDTPMVHLLSQYNY